MNLACSDGPLYTCRRRRLPRLPRSMTSQLRPFLFLCACLLCCSVPRPAHPEQPDGEALRTFADNGLLKSHAELARKVAGLAQRVEQLERQRPVVRAGASNKPEAVTGEGDAQMKLPQVTINVTKGDTIIVVGAPINVTCPDLTSTVYVRVAKLAGPALPCPGVGHDWVVSSGANPSTPWRSGATVGAYEATDDGEIAFGLQWHMNGPGTGVAGYRQIIVLNVGTQRSR